MHVRCPFHPSHAGGAATLRPGKRGGDSFFHCRKCRWSLPLGALYGVVRGREWLREPGLRRLPKSSSAEWTTRLYAETDRIDLPDVELELPAGTDALRRVAGGFVLLLRCHLYSRREGDAFGVPWSQSFGAGWCGVPPSTFRDQRRKLVASGWLVPAGSAGGKPCRSPVAGRRLPSPELWLPKGWTP